MLLRSQHLLASLAQQTRPTNERHAPAPSAFQLLALSLLLFTHGARDQRHASSSERILRNCASSHVGRLRVDLSGHGEHMRRAACDAIGGSRALFPQTVSIVLSFYLIGLHWKYYSQPMHQRYIIRFVSSQQITKPCTWRRVLTQAQNSGSHSHLHPVLIAEHLLHQLRGVHQLGA